MGLEPRIDAEEPRYSSVLSRRSSALIRGVFALAVPWSLGAQPASAPVQRAPVLSMPEAGLDDTASYQGYKTRFYRDAKGNVLQVYLEPRGGRVVNLWADAANESIGFTVRDGAGQTVPLRWAGAEATVGDSGAMRT